jgi:hypothetical protein
MAAGKGARLLAQAATGFWLVYLLAAAGTLTRSHPMLQRHKFLAESSAFNSFVLQAS